MMKNRVGLIDFGGAGNIESIRRALLVAGAEVRLVRQVSEFHNVDRYVLPGVGSFNEIMASIRAQGLEHAVRDAALSKPTLGICLGMQILATVGYEYGETDGLNLIEGEVRLMQCKAPIPHMGFSSLEFVGESPLFAGISASDEFYFMHSYEFVNYTNVCALSSHGKHRFVSAVSCGNLFGVQFHPEKSREPGIQIFRNFIEL